MIEVLDRLWPVLIVLWVGGLVLLLTWLAVS
jgi:hypothetical protein